MHDDDNLQIDTQTSSLLLAAAAVDYAKEVLSYTYFDFGSSTQSA